MFKLENFYSSNKIIEETLKNGTKTKEGLHESCNKRSAHVNPNNNKEKIPMQWLKSLLVRTKRRRVMLALLPCAHRSGSPIRGGASSLSQTLPTPVLNTPMQFKLSKVVRWFGWTGSVEVLTLLRGSFLGRWEGTWTLSFDT